MLYLFFISLMWIAGIDPPVIRGNPFSPSTSFERDNVNGLDMEEIWLNIVGYEGLYQVSNLGGVRSLERIVLRKDGLIKNFKGKTLSPSVGSHGYLGVSLCKNGEQRTHLIHRLIAEHFIVNTNNKPEINHIDGNKLNNSICNLEWCTGKENVTHAFKTGLARNTLITKYKKKLAQRGERNTMAKLTESDVLKIRELLNYMSNKDIAKIYAIDPSAVSNIKRRRNWAHL